MGGKVIYDEIDKVFDEGVKTGELSGLKQGIDQERIKNIKNLMLNMNISAAEAMKNLGIPDGEQQKYIDKI